jgi:hypothetical protein
VRPLVQVLFGQALCFHVSTRAPCARSLPVTSRVTQQVEDLIGEALSSRMISRLSGFS